MVKTRGEPAGEIYITCDGRRGLETLFGSNGDLGA
jgi:hypothetical protein